MTTTRSRTVSHLKALNRNVDDTHRNFEMSVIKGILGVVGTQSC